ncbi:MAG: acetate--CoA ligase family protein [Candidatus Hodarchaeales archaeon]
MSENEVAKDIDRKWKENLDKLFSPDSIAIVGASRRKGSIGRSILKNIINFGYEGVVYPVNPKANSVGSIKCYPSLSAIPDQIDLAIIAVPSKFVLSVMKEAVDLKIKSAVIITAGFKEIGEKGEVLEIEIANLAKSANMRIVGPNCMGILHGHSPIVNATFAPRQPLPGRIGFISQSGALGVVVLDYATRLGLGFSKFVSLGNKADVNANDMIENLGNDPNTDVILAYLESFADPWNFSEIAVETSRKKPIVIVKSGKTAAGARAATSHTGALATAETALTAVLSSTGVIRVSTVEELFDCAMAFSKLNLPMGNRVCIVTNSGGPGTLATDLLIGLGLKMAELSDATKDKLRSNLPAEASIENPIDLIASGGPKEFHLTLTATSADENIDSIIAIFVPPMMIHSLEIANVIDDVVKSSSKPILGCIMGRDDLIEQGIKYSFPMYKFPESAVLALRALTAYANWRKQPILKIEKIVEVSPNVLDIIPNAISNGQRNLTTKQIEKLFQGYGFNFPTSEIVLIEEEALYSAQTIGFPVVMKMATQLVEHKTDQGGVIIDIRTIHEFKKAWNKIQNAYDRLRVPYDHRAILIQKYYQGGVEMALGASVDPQFGPLAMVGTGGILVEIMEDISFGRVPLSRAEARKMIRQLKGYALLLGYRGDNPVDINALEDAVLKISQLVSENRAIVELDVNPLLLLEHGHEPIILDARVKLK